MQGHLHMGITPGSPSLVATASMSHRHQGSHLTKQKPALLLIYCLSKKKKLKKIYHFPSYLVTFTRCDLPAVQVNESRTDIIAFRQKNDTEKTTLKQTLKQKKLAKLN